MPERGWLELAGPARRDVAEIWAWVAERGGTSRADSVVARLRTACVSLADNPLIGRERRELRAGVRSLAVAPHVILYEPVPDGVRVLRIIHGARHLRRVLQERSPGNGS